MQDRSTHFSVLQHLSPWIQSSNELERNRGVQCFLELMKTYQLHSDTDEVLDKLFKVLLCLALCYKTSIKEDICSKSTQYYCLLHSRHLESWRSKESCWEEWFLVVLIHTLTLDWLLLTVSKSYFEYQLVVLVSWFTIYQQRVYRGFNSLVNLY